MRYLRYVFIALVLILVSSTLIVEASGEEIYKRESGIAEHRIPEPEERIKVEYYIDGQHEKFEYFDFTVAATRATTGLRYRQTKIALSLGDEDNGTVDYTIWLDEGAGV